MFNKETEYALRALVYIQKSNWAGYRPGTDEISREIDAPKFFTAKILQRIAKLGFINSAKGRGGGFFFDESKPELSLIEIAQTTGDIRIISSCAFGMKKCDCENPCPMHHKYAPIREAMENMVRDETIQSLAKKTN